MARKFFGLTRVKVSGDSTLPTLTDGDQLWVRWPRTPGAAARGVEVGDIVVIEREVQPGIFYIKRVSEIEIRAEGQNGYEGVTTPHTERKFFVLSDNPAGNDSRTWDWLRADEIVAKAALK